jgi:beta-galactosidase
MTHSLNRREFLRTSAGCALAGTISLQAAPLLALPVNPSAPLTRIYPLDQGWLWNPLVPPNAHAPQLDESTFIPVTLPHSNTFVPAHGADQKSYQFVSLYRRHFQRPSASAGTRTFVDFEGVLTTSRVYLNGALLGEYAGGFTPFSFELTAHLLEGQNLLSVEVDSREDNEIPPFGYQVDYLTFGGIYRSVSLRTTGPTAIDSVQVLCYDVLTPTPSVEVTVQLDGPSIGLLLEIAILGPNIDQNRVLATQQLRTSTSHIFKALRGLTLWSVDSPNLYTLRLRLLHNGELVEERLSRFGLREASFTPQGFSLNGSILKLRGLNRHQTFPYAGAAMPARVQRRDAAILKHQLKCNVVRCSHYPPSIHFLEACDELGLLVIDETPGWQHVGDSPPWRKRYLDNTRIMIHRDRNHPSVILWSVRINESRDFHDLYLEANRLAHELDPSRQTTGVRYFQESELLEDVFSMNDFQFPLKQPNHPLYLNTEVVGAEYPVRPWDDNARNKEHILRYANILNQINSSPAYAGVLGWCAFDYATHSDFGSGDHICYHGVVDTFREPKPAAGFFRSQCSPHDEPVLEPGFHLAMNDQAGDFKKAILSSNCDQIRCFIGKEGVWHHIIDISPAHDEFPHLEHPPFYLTLPDGNDDWGDLRLDGYVDNVCVLSRSLSGRGIDQLFSMTVDDTELVADGADSTRVVLRVTDQYGAIRPLCSDPIQLVLEGPATLTGPSLLSLTGGRSAVWIRTTSQPGRITLKATHPNFGTQTVKVQAVATS